MPRRSDARRRAIKATGRLVQEQGYAATGLDEVLAVSGAPKGSFYHHFPGGKEQLVAEALTASGENIRRLIDAVVDDAASTPAVVRAIGAFQADLLENSGFEHGCPVATVTLEVASRSERIRAAASAAYDSWIASLERALQRDGHPDPARVARFTLATLEGALVLARAAADASIVTDVAEDVAAMLEAR